MIEVSTMHVYSLCAFHNSDMKRLTTRLRGKDFFSGRSTFV